jgi:hypothetical protein
MPPGDYGISVNHPDYLPGHSHAKITPTARVEASVDLQRGGRISGRVTDSGGAPLPGTLVLLTDEKSRFTVSNHYSATTDAEGRYALPPLPRGAYGVRFRHDRFRRADRYGFHVIQGTESYQVDVALEVGLMLSGRVTDEDGAPLAGVAVTASNSQTGVLATSDAEGRWETHGLADEPLTVLLRHQGYATTALRGIKPNSEGVDVRLPKAAVLRGRIEADPLPDSFSVILSRYDEDLKKVMRVEARAFTSAPGGGEFQIGDLTAATYWVEVEAPGYEAADRPEVVLGKSETSPPARVRLRKK